MEEIEKQEARPVLRLDHRLRLTEQDGETRYLLSTYKGVPATDEEMLPILRELATAFPVYNSKIAVLVKVLMANNFTAKRLSDACMHVMATCKYKEPTIADIVSYDRCLRLYTYQEACRLVTTGQARFENDGGDLKIYCKHPVCLFYRVSDAVKCGLVKGEK